MKRIFIIFIITLLFIPINTVYAANSLGVQKLVKNKNINVGDNVTIILSFTNPFNQELPIKIKDKNVFGNNGIDIQCLEYTLPNKKDYAIAYQPIKPFTSGKYVLGQAEVTYTNPETGKEETVRSNSLEIIVNSSQGQQGQAQGITTIYRCNGMNMESTSYTSSGSSFNVQISSSGIQQQINQMFNQRQQKGNPSNRVQNNQLNQNTNALKKQMERQIEQRRQMEEMFKKEVIQNQKVQKEHKKLSSMGYNLTNASFNPISNDTGSFRLNYQKPNGSSVTIKGEMQNGSIKNIMTQSTEDRQKILQALQQNPQFKNFDNQLKNQGFNQTRVVFNQLSQNYTQITIHYRATNREEKNITADYINETVKNVSMEDGLKRSNTKDYWWMFFIVILMVGLIGYFLYKKFHKPKTTIFINSDKTIEKPINYLKESRKMIKEAIKLFRNKHEKNAYQKVSEALRFYFSYKFNIKKELTSAEVLSYLRRHGNTCYKEARKCLNLCDLVEFAKYKTNKEDFEKIIKKAISLIK